MSTAELDPISRACRLLREGAAELKNCHTLAATGHDWTGEPEAKAAYDEHMATADALERWADSIGAGGVESLRGRQCLHRISEPAGEYPALPDAAWVVVEHLPVGGGWVRHERRQSYNADQMRAYVDADRAMRAAQPAGAANTRAQENVALLAEILNRRPAMNAGLTQAYAAWTAEVYDLMGAIAAEPANEDRAQAAPESFLEIPDVQDESGINSHYSRELVLECINAALASHGQAPASRKPKADSADYVTEWAVTLWKGRERIRKELRASHGQAPASLQSGEQPLPMLVKDIAADLATTPIQVCMALSVLGFGSHSVNMAVTPTMAQALRAHFSATEQAAPAAVAGPHVTDAMALAFHNALSDGAIGSDEVEEIKAGLRAALAAAPTTQPAPQQEAASVDLKTMELAESVGLIGPASRTHDLHAAIQRFHDLICANATIKAAQMAAEAISEAAPQQGGVCDKAPAGWLCTRQHGHEGPCAAEPTLSARSDEWVEGYAAGVRDGWKDALRTQQAAPTPQADSQPAVDALAEAEYFIDNPSAWSNFDQRASDAIAAVCKAFRAARAPADSALKDHQIAALVNELRDIAIQYHGTQQLRERIARAVIPALKAQATDSVLEDAARAGFFLQLPQRPKPEAPAGTVGLDWDAYSGAQMLAYGRDCSNAAIVAAQKPGGL